LPRSARVAFAVRLHSRKYRWLHAPATNLDPGASPRTPYTVTRSPLRRLAPFVACRAEAASSREGGWRASLRSVASSFHHRQPSTSSAALARLRKGLERQWRLPTLCSWRRSASAHVLWMRCAGRRTSIRIYSAAAFRRGTLARVGIFQVAQPVPHQAADGELVVEDSRSARSIAVDRAWTPGTAEWAGYLLSIEVLRRPRDRDRKQTSLSTGRAH
jgi:hypothetical protein